MFIIGYDKVVSRLPLFVEQNINARAPLKFKRRLEASIKVIPQLTVFWDKHITLRMKVMLLRRCSKEKMVTHPNSKRLALCRGKQGFNMCQSFLFLKQKENCFGRWLFLSTNGNRVLAIFHTKQVESGSELILSIYSMHFYIQCDTPPTFAYTNHG